MNNESLRDLIFCRNNDSYASFTCILCSKSSILGTYQSNHTLERLCSDDSESWLPVELTYVLQINRENSKSQIARLKIIKTHFSGIDINTLPFTDMGLEVLPNAIAWMGQDCGHDKVSDVLFALLRNMPSLGGKAGIKRGHGSVIYLPTKWWLMQGEAICPVSWSCHCQICLGVSGYIKKYTHLNSPSYYTQRTRYVIAAVFHEGDTTSPYSILSITW